MQSLLVFLHAVNILLYRLVGESDFLRDDVLFFFFKQKTAYEMRISDWSSDVCSSDLQGFGAQCFFQLWSSEMFPTLLRSTAQGVMFAVVRIALGIFRFFVPWLTATGFQTLAWI